MVHMGARLPCGVTYVVSIKRVWANGMDCHCHFLDICQLSDAQVTVQDRQHRHTQQQNVL